ncbi:unnamed protein product [Laminaria digitata]
MWLAYATLVLSLSVIPPPVSPLLSGVQPHASLAAGTASEGGTHLGLTTYAERPTASSSSGSNGGGSSSSSSSSRGGWWLQHHRCRGSDVSITGSLWPRGTPVLHGAGEEGRQEARTRRYSKSTQQDVELTAQQGQGQHQVYHPLEEKLEEEEKEEEEEGDGGEEEEEEDREEGGRERGDQARNTHLEDVVARLQGDIQAGSTPQVRSHVKLDGLFAELRAGEPSAPAANASLNSTTSVATSATKVPPSYRKARAPRAPRAAPDTAATATTTKTPPNKQTDTTGGGLASPPSDDLESLSDMLDRLQATAKARDLAEAGERAAAMRSGGPVSEGLSSVTMSKHKDMMTRFASIRDGRVSWAILPLVMRARKAGIPLSTGVYNAAIGAYLSTPRKYADALRVLDLLRHSGDPSVRPDLTSYNTAMWVCGEAGQWRVVYEMLAQMKSEGIEPNTSSYNCALNGLAKRRQWYRARRLFRKMVGEGLSPDAKSYNGLVEAAGMGSLSPRQNMIQIVYDMEQAGVEPTSYTYTILLDCLAQRGKAFDGFQVVMARLVDARAPLLPLGYRAGLLFCKEFGDWRRAMVLMEDMRVAKRRPSAGVMYLLAVQACSKGGQWERALSLMVERRTTVAIEAKEQLALTDGQVPDQVGRSVSAQAQTRAAELDMKTLEAVLSAVSEAGQFEVAIRLVQQMRSAGDTPSKKCYLYTLRAASKWGRWDVIEGLMKDMRALRVGVVDIETLDGVSEEGEGEGLRLLSSDCYPSLVEAYAQVSMWERAIEVYQEGFVVGREGVEAVNYRVFECVLKACVGAKDGYTALEMIRRQAAEPKRAQRLTSKSTIGEAGNVSGGPPDRRCWCLAAEALGRAGMVEEGHDILKAMVNAGIPVRESTKQDVPSLMPLPTSEDGFDWHQRKRRRRPRRLGGASRLSPRGLTVKRREAAIRQSLDPSGEVVVAGELGDGAEVSKNFLAGPEVSKNFLAGAELSKGVVNGEGCAAAAVSAAGGQASSGGKRSLGLGWLLVSDWRYKISAMEREASGGGRGALERKRRRMDDFSQKAIEKREKLKRIGGGSVGKRNAVDGGLITVGEDNAAPAVGAAHAQIELRPGGRRGRNEALTLRMRVRRTPGVLGRGGGGIVDGSRRRDGRRPNRTDRRVAGNGANRRGGRGGGVGGGGDKRRGSGW